MICEITIDPPKKSKGGDDTDGPFATAVLLARKGEYADAFDSLRAAVEQNDCTDAEALDLQARMCVQQGLFLQAESCWRKALRLEPTNLAYIDALDRLRQQQLPTVRLRSLLAFTAAMLALGLLTWQVVGVNPQVRLAQQKNEASLEALNASLARLEKVSPEHGQPADVTAALTRRIDLLEASLADLTNRLDAMAVPPAPATQPTTQPTAP